MLPAAWVAQAKPGNATRPSAVGERNASAGHAFKQPTGAWAAGSMERMGACGICAGSALKRTAIAGETGQGSGNPNVRIFSLRSRVVGQMHSIIRPHCGEAGALARQMWRGGWVASVVLLCCMAIACGGKSGPAVRFTRIPRASVGGPDRFDSIEGRVIGARPGERIVLYAHWGPWWVQPLADLPYTTIQPDSTWRNLTHFGTQYAALLVEGNYHPPASVDVLPSTGHGVVAVAMVDGKPQFWQTWWFLLTATLTSATIVAAYFIQRMVLLSAAEKRFRELIETMPAMAIITRSDGRCTFVNREWVQFTGVTAEQMAISGWQTAVHPHDLSQVVNKWRESLASGEALEHETRIRRASDGAYRWFLIRAVPLRDKHGKILKWCGAATDIEDRKRAEQLQAEFAQISRMNTMSELAASLAHEIKQPIGAAVTNAEVCMRLLDRSEPDVEDAREVALEMTRDARRAADIIDRVRLLYEKGRSQLELVDINEVIGEMLIMLRDQASRYSVTMRTDTGAGLTRVMADRVQLQQVFMNLMVNGIEAMKETGGELSIRSQMSEEGYLMISISDTGVGLPAERADEIFNAFFTTKPRGTGLGLAITRSIVESHGGRVWAAPNSERGTTFYFTLPVRTVFAA
jgi:PAS domain S-box-containing protein